MNFKIRVAENIGSDSCELFGCPGTVLEVKDGILQDNDEFEWTNAGKLFHSLEEINIYFMDEDEYQTRFEMAEEKESI